MSLFALYDSLAGVRVAGFSLLSLKALASAVLWGCFPLSILSASDLISAIFSVEWLFVLHTLVHVQWSSQIRRKDICIWK
jgi:hypothetical protein